MLRQLIVYVLQILVHVPMALKLRELLVLHIILICARRVMMDITKRGTPVRHVDLDVVLEQEKQLLVLPQPIVYVPRILVLVPRV